MMGRFSALVSLAAVQLTGAVCAAQGFLPGHLLLSARDSVLMLNPATGDVQTLITVQPPRLVGDLVFNSVTNSAFILREHGTEIVELNWSEQQGFQVSSFLSELSDAGGMTVDSSGNLYFGGSTTPQPSLSNAIFKATPSGEVTIFARPDGPLLVPNSMAFSPDVTERFKTGH